jgi:hypothetical protein
MQKLIIVYSIAACLLLGSCKKHEDDHHEHGGPVNYGVSLALLRVDYQTHQFEGCKMLHFNAFDYNPQNVPVQMLYIPPGDFGNITLLHAPTGDTIFDGSIVWNGMGSMKFPAALDAVVSVTPTAEPAPDSNNVQIISPDSFVNKADYHIPEVWTPISKLDVTKAFMSTGYKKVALFLYTPSVGVGNPADWDYYWLLYPGPQMMTSL